MSKKNVAELLSQAVEELKEHESDYSYHTPKEFIERCEAVLDPKRVRPRLLGGYVPPEKK